MAVNENVRINFEATNLDAIEGKIKAIGGAINILGGSIELAVGALGLLEVDEKTTKRFQEAAASAISFADGAKRVFEGYKELREAADLFRKAQQATTAATTANTVATAANNAVQASSVGVLGKARAAWAALTAVLARNPITAIAVALAAVIATIIAYTSSTDDAAEATEALNKANEKLLKSFEDRADREKTFNSVRLAQMKAAGATEKQLLQQQLKDAEEAYTTATNNRKKFQQQAGITVTMRGTQATFTGPSQADIDQLKKLYAAANDAAADYRIAQAELDDFNRSTAKERQEKAQAQANEILKIQENAIRNTQLLALEGYDRDLQDLKNSTKDKLAVVKGNAKAELAVNNEYNALKAKLDKKYRDDTAKQLRDIALMGMDSQTKELEELDDFFETKFELFKGNEEVTNQLLALLRKKRLEIIDKYNKEEEAKDKEAQDKALENLQKFRDETIQQIIDSESRSYLLRLKLLEKFFDNQMKAYAKDSKEYKDLQKQKEEALKGFTEKGTKLNEFFSSKSAQQIAGVLGALNNITSGALRIAEQNSEDRLNAIEVEYNKKLQNVVGTEQEIAIQTEQLEYEKNVAMEAERKRAFEAQKKFKIADTITSGLSAAFQAFGGAMSLGPILGPIVGGALSLMILGMMANTVASIKKQQYVGSTPTPPSRGGGGGATGGIATSLMGGQFNQPIPNPNDPGNNQFGNNTNNPMNSPQMGMNNEPIRAYVVSSDVQNGLQAEQQLQNRRRL